MSLPRHTNSDSQRLQVGTRATLIPPRTSTSPSILAVHTHPKYWPDPLIWNPERWITKESGEEALVTPPRDTFLPWSDGPQNCPGAKFSQVEFVAVIALIMQKNRLTTSTITLRARSKLERVRAVLSDCDMQLLL
jgi:cytochrome P450